MNETETVRVMRKLTEKLEAFRLACKQVEAAAGDIEKFVEEQISGNHE